MGFAAGLQSSLHVKLVVMFSMLLLVVSAFALLFGLLLPKEERVSSSRSRVGNTQLGIDAVAKGDGTRGGEGRPVKDFDDALDWEQQRIQS